ncbi:MAG TPA: MBL fold metallo-hydrolase [Xanthobacteraceae bacterium]|nr:MBL fold metallo-hydrolase [Xanthobacteraceae bacterium]
MHLQIVGCGDAFGTGGRFNTCFHLVGKNVNALIDCGASSLVGMNKLAIDRNAVSTIIITHFHADHIGGVPFFILEANYVLKRKGALTIAGPPGLKARYAEMMESAYPGTANLQLSFPLTLHEVEIGKRNEISGMKVTPFRVVHDERAGPCLGYRCEVEGKTVAYSGDTQWTDAVIDIGRNADLFICEAYTRDKPINTHMALSALEKHLGEIKPKRLILTHMGLDMLAHRAEVPFETADDGKLVEL